jgi:hypothetical protein
MTRIAIFLSFHAFVLGGCAFMQQPSGSSPVEPGAVASAEASEGSAASSPSPSGAARGSEPASTPGTARSPEPETSTGAASTPEEATPTPKFSAEPLRPKNSVGVVSGTLGFDTVEGGCAYLETADGTRYQVIYPDGWRIDGSTGHLLGPGGEDARPDSVVSVRGSIVTDMASICQVGPIFRATEVMSAGG